MLENKKRLFGATEKNRCKESRKKMSRMKLKWSETRVQCHELVFVKEEQCKLWRTHDVAQQQQRLQKKCIQDIWFKDINNKSIITAWQSHRLPSCGAFIITKTGIKQRLFSRLFFIFIIFVAAVVREYEKFFVQQRFIVILAVLCCASVHTKYQFIR